ncbi:MAG: DUF2520 domain-containing protein [Buchananella hordeovulneris]|nr:DUF2520 domain-containing protein [Buchananella hordeovulneris]
MSATGRLGIGIVGAGRVGAVLGSAWRATGHEVVAVSAGSPASRERADVMLPGVPVVEVEEVLARAELVLLAVPDDVLPALVEGLAKLGCFRPGQIVVHPAGRYGVEVLAPATSAGAIGIALHPAMTFSGTSLDLPRLTGCPIAVTAAPGILPIGQALAVELGGEPFVVAEDARLLYHCALAHGANHLVTLVNQAVRLARAAGVEEAATLRPLLEAALDRVLRESDAALTGPVSRADSGTVLAHVAAIEAATLEAQVGDEPAIAAELAAAARTYRHLAAATIDRCAALGKLTPEQEKSLRAALQ